MSDLVIDVRQVSSYPLLPGSSGNETVLLQQGGLGSPYASIDTATLVATALNRGPAMGVGFTPPANANFNQLFAGALNLPSTSQILWDAYITTADAQVSTTAGPSASQGWAPQVGFNWATSPITTGALQWFNLMLLDPAGSLHLPLGTLSVARDPGTAFEVATLNYVSNHTVASFNARTGPVQLNRADIYQALQPDSPLATQNYVQQAIFTAMTTGPLVSYWNGRTGLVNLMLSDISCVFFQSGQQPITQTPPLGSNDYSIANTQWVQSVYAPAPTTTTPPTIPAGTTSGQLWWDATDGNLYVWYNDGTSSQWVSAMADSGGISQSQGDARYVQQSGGTMTGPLDINYPYPSAQTALAATISRNNTAATFTPMVAVNAGVGGSVTSSSGSPPAYFSFNTNNDGLDARAVGGAYGFQTAITTVAGETGDRTAFFSAVNVSQATANVHPTYFVSGYFTSTAAANSGGTSSAPVGNVLAINPLAQLSAGATYYEGLAAAEFDINALAGCEVAYKTGISIIQGSNSAVQGSVTDIAMLFGNAIGAVGWKVGIAFGAPFVGWGIDPAGTLIGAMSPGIGGSPAYAAAWGVDFNPVAFSGGLIRGTGFSVNGAGYTLSSGLGIPGVAAANAYDLSKHISLYGVGGSTGFGFSITANSLNYVTGSGSVHNFVVGTAGVGDIDSTGLNMPVGQTTANPGTFSYAKIGSSSGPTITEGTGAPAVGAQPIGSLYLRTDGSVGSTLYVSRGGGTWAAVAGV